jgi:hypothetical protein
MSTAKTWWRRAIVANAKPVSEETQCKRRKKKKKNKKKHTRVSGKNDDMAVFGGVNKS